MRLSSGSQMNAGEWAIHRMAQGRDVYLGKMYIHLAAAMDSSHPLPIDNGQLQRSGERRVDATLDRARIHQRGKLSPR